jgi:protein MpaA
MKKILILTSLVAGLCLVALSVWVFTQSRQKHALLSDSNQRVASEPGVASSHSESVARTEVKIVGYTKRNTPIKGFYVGEGKKYVMVLGAIHGNEPSSASVVESFASVIARSDAIKDLTIIVIPVVNPDGLRSQTRTNDNGVDVNRNFPATNWKAESKGARYYPGAKPSTEPETRAIIELIQKSPPALIISVHAPFHCVNWDGPAQKIAEVMAQASGYPVCADIGYPTPGSLGSYVGKDLNIPIITLELRDARSSEEVTAEGVTALEAAIKWVAVSLN